MEKMLALRRFCPQSSRGVIRILLLELSGLSRKVIYRLDRHLAFRTGSPLKSQLFLKKMQTVKVFWQN